MYVCMYIYVCIYVSKWDAKKPAIDAIKVLIYVYVYFIWIDR